MKKSINSEEIEEKSKNPFIRIIQLRKKGITWRGIFRRIFAVLGIDIRSKHGLSKSTIELLYVEYRNKRNRLFHIVRKLDDSIIVIETGVLGDCILVIDALRHLEAFCRKNNYELDIICGKAMADIFKNNAHLNYANYICYSNRDKVSLRELKQLACILGKKRYKYALMRDGHSLGFRLSGVIDAKESIYYSYDANRRNVIDTKLANKYFTEIKNIEDQIFIPNIWKMLLQRIGVDYRYTSLGTIETVNKEYGSGYILVCPEASNIQRNISIWQCEEIIKHLKEKYERKIIISTNARNADYTRRLKCLVDQYGCEAQIGTTSINQFISLVSGAICLIGCDSGSVHLAAALGVPNMYLRGYWDPEYFLPYSYDIKKDGNALPVPVCCQAPDCKFCGAKRADENNKNIAFLKCQQKGEGEQYMCLSQIKMSDIIATIDMVMDIA